MVDTNPHNRGPALFFGGCSRLGWLRPSFHGLLLRSTFSPGSVLPDPPRARAADHRLDRFGRNLHPEASDGRNGAKMLPFRIRTISLLSSALLQVFPISSQSWSFSGNLSEGNNCLISSVTITRSQRRLETYEIRSYCGFQPILRTWGLPYGHMIVID